MIPRYNGLVPAIRGPAAANVSSASASTTSATQAPAAPAARATVQRFVIQPPPPSADAAAIELADPGAEQTAPGASTEPERRLFSFLPSADCTAPPCELRVAARFFAEDAAVDDSGSDDDELDEAEETEERAGHRSAAAPHAATTATVGSGSGAARRRQRRVLRREPMRLEYDGFVTPSAKVAARTVRLASTPAPAFRHLSCVLLQLPAWWREGPPPAHAESAGPETSPGASATVLRRPVLQLWAERNTSTAASAHVRTLLSASPRDGTGISPAWGADTPVKISKKDWKTMDAADADLHRPTNWSDNDDEEDGADRGSDGQPLDPVTARARKRAKDEATHTAVRAFLAGTKAALRQQQQGAVDSDMDVAPPPPPPPSAAGRAGDARQRSDTPPTATTAAAAAAAKASPAPPVAPPASTARRVISLSTPVAPPPPPPAPPQAATPLSSLAAQVLTEMQTGEARANASLNELQKRILKQLPDFAAMSVKMKAPATRQEAVTWFQTSQQALRMWLVEHGHSIAADGTVTFSAS